MCGIWNNCWQAGRQAGMHCDVYICRRCATEHRRFVNYFFYLFFYLTLNIVGIFSTLTTRPPATVRMSHVDACVCVSWNKINSISNIYQWLLNFDSILFCKWSEIRSFQVQRWFLLSTWAQQFITMGMILVWIRIRERNWKAIRRYSSNSIIFLVGFYFLSGSFAIS